MHRFKNRSALLLLLLTGLAGTAAAFPFWLASPVRSNPNDPQSPLYRPTATPVPPTATPVVTNTFTTAPTNTLAPTNTTAPTNTNTTAPTSTNTVPPGSTNTYTFTPTWTPTPTATFTVAAGGGPGQLIANFESSATSANDSWNQPIVTGFDSDGTTLSPFPWGAGSQTATNGPSAAGSNAGCISGTVVAQNNGASIYPFAFIALCLTPTGNVGGAGGKGVNITPYSPNSGVQFDYKGTSGVTYVVQMIDTAAGCGDFYQYQFTAADSSWHTLDVYFPGSGGANVFSQPNYGCSATPLSITSVGAVQFKVVAPISPAAPQAYSLCVDNVTFNVPAVPTPTPTVPAGTPGPLLANFENSASSAGDSWNEPIVTGFDSDGTTLSPFPWGAGSQTSTNGPSAAGSNAGCISGTVVAQNGASSIYPFAYIALDLTPTGNVGGAGGKGVNLAPYDPNNGVQFDYKGTAGVTYVVQMIDTAAGCGDFYQYQFTAADAGWHTLDVYFPGSGAPNVFSQPNYGCSATPLSITSIGAVQFKVVAPLSPAAPQAYNLCVDNVTFAVPAVPTPTATPTIGPIVANFENSPSTANDNWNQPIVTGFDTDGTTLTPFPWAAGSQTAGNGPSATGSYSGCMSGTIAVQNGATSIYPFAYMALDLTPSGNVGGSGGAGTSVAAYSPNNGLQFDYKGTAGVSYVVQMIDTNAGCGDFFQYQFTPADANWHTLAVYFPGVAAPAVFSQPNYGCSATSLNLASVGAVQFKVVAPLTPASPEAYSLCVDNVTFAVPAAPTAPALDVSGGVNTAGQVITTFEYAPFSNASTIWPSPGFAVTVNQDSTDSAANAMTIPVGGNWANTSSVADNGPTLSGSSCIEMAGTTVASGYATIMALFNNSGYPQAGGGGVSSVNIESVSPNKRLVFDYKAGAASVGQTMIVQLITQDITDFSYWNYIFTPADTNWHTLIIYFPDAAFSPKFSRPWGTPAVEPWEPAQASGIEIGPTSPSSAESYDIKVDNLWFD